MAIWAAAWPQRVSEATEKTAPAAPRRYLQGAPEIYFHKAIDNSRLVRTADPSRTREVRLFSAAVVFCLMIVLLYLGQHCRSIEYGYKIEDLRVQRDQMADLNRNLRLEEATLKSPERISKLASEQGLALPSAGQVEQLDESSKDGGAPIMARAETVSVVSVPN